MNSRWFPRSIHAVVVIATMMAFGIVLYCVAASVGLQVEHGDARVSWVWMALPWLVLLASAWGIWKRLRYSAAIPLLGISAAFLCYMAWDDSSRPPAPKIDVPIPPESKNYAAYRRLIKDATPLPEAPTLSALPTFPGKPKQAS